MMAFSVNTHKVGVNEFFSPPMFGVNVISSSTSNKFGHPVRWRQHIPPNIKTKPLHCKGKKSQKSIILLTEAEETLKLLKYYTKSIYIWLQAPAEV